MYQKIVELFKWEISEEEKQKYFELLKENYNWDKIAHQVFLVYKSLATK